MHVAVDRSVCQQYGQCEALAPDLFRLDDDDVLTYVESPPPELLAAAAAAADACPMQAISLLTERSNETSEGR